MTIFDDYKDNKGRHRVSATLPGACDPEQSDWQRSRTCLLT